MMNLARYVDRDAPQAPWRFAHRAADAAAPRVEVILRRALTQLRVGNIENPDLEPLGRVLWLQIMPLLEQTYGRTARVFAPTTVQKAQRKPKPKSRREPLIKPSQLRYVNPLAVRWAERHAAEMVTRITQETREAIALLVVESAQGKKTVTTVAREVRPLIGVNVMQAKRLIALRKELRAAGYVLAAINRKLEFERARMIRDRAKMIARTETLSASNAGQLSSWQDAQANGFIGDDMLKKLIVTPGETCDRCMAIEAEGPVPINANFSFGKMNPPVHPNCRCGMGLVEKET